jgi:hypothetical protein
MSRIVRAMLRAMVAAVLAGVLPAGASPADWGREHCLRDRAFRREPAPVARHSLSSASFTRRSASALCSRLTWRIDHESKPERACITSA